MPMSEGYKKSEPQKNKSVEYGPATEKKTRFSQASGKVYTPLNAKPTILKVDALVYIHTYIHHTFIYFLKLNIQFTHTRK